jgi:aquaporin NIP
MKKKELLAEFMGTFILVFAGTGAIVVDSLTWGLGNVGVWLVFGLVVVVLVYCFWHISWAHFNPAVTVWLSVAGKFDKRCVLDYVVVQVLGWILASFTLFLIFSENFVHLKEVAYMWATFPRGSVFQSFVLEIVLTFILLLVVYFTAVHKNAIKELSGLAIGFTIWLETIFAWLVTGASMNPARSIGPALVSFHLDHLWVYIVATLIWAVLASLLYRWFEEV